MPYQAASGHDNTAGYATPAPQPACQGIQYAETRYAANGSVTVHGEARTEWRYGFMTPAQHATMMTLLGLSVSVKAHEVTIQTVTNDFTTFDDFNAIAVRPEPGVDFTYDGGRFVDVVWRFRQLEATS